jgi:hypothetical protein
MIRVQMVSGGIPAYQNDFANEADATLHSPLRESAR